MGAKDIEEWLDERLESVVFVDGIVIERYRGPPHYVAQAASEYAKCVIACDNGRQPLPIQETFHMRPCETRDEAKVRWREYAMEDAIAFDNFRQKSELANV